jgi:hypothetical protein
MAASPERRIPTDLLPAMEVMHMRTRSRAATRRRAPVAGITVLAIAFVGALATSIARAQGGRAPDQRPNQGTNAPGILNPYAAPPMHGSFAPYLVKDPTADERAAVAGRVYGAVLDEWERNVGARAGLELVERLGPWSLRWQEAQDNAARSRAARYQSLSDHLGRMSALEQGRFHHETGPAEKAGGPVPAKPPGLSAEAARFFRPVDGWSIDRIIPIGFESGRPLNPVGVAVTPAEQAEIAGRVYRAILDEAVDRYLASPRQGEARREGAVIFDALLAERLGFWSDLWGRSQDAADRAAAVRSPADRVARPRARSAGGRRAAIRAHAERMRDLEDGRFVDDAGRRAGRPVGGPVDMGRFREFAEVARFYRTEADGTESGQAATADRIYGAILDEAVHRYRAAPRAGGVPADVRVGFDSRLAERLAAWSVRWAQAQVRDDGSRASQFAAVRSHLERMTALEDGRALRNAFERAGPAADGLAAPVPPRESADVARFFRLEALWELELIRSR